MLQIEVDGHPVVTQDDPACALITFALPLPDMLDSDGDAINEKPLLLERLSLRFDGIVAVDMCPDGLRGFSVQHPDGTRTVCTLTVEP